MKKFILSIITGVSLMSSINAKTAVVYFSCTGNTQRLSQTAAKATSADLFQIIPEEAYTNADLDWTDKSSRSTKECNDPKSRPAIKNKINLDEYENVIIAYPIWWYDAPKIIYTFVESANLQNKVIVPICTSGGSGIGRSPSNLEKVSNGGTWKSGAKFSSRASEEELKRFFEKIFN